MGRKQIGYLVITLSGLMLAIEIFLLKLFQSIDYGVGYPLRHETPLEYLGDPAIFIALLITVSLFIFGLYLAIKKENNDQNSI